MDKKIMVSIIFNLVLGIQCPMQAMEPKKTFNTLISIGFFKSKKDKAIQLNELYILAAKIIEKAVARIVHIDNTFSPEQYRLLSDTEVELIQKKLEDITKSEPSDNVLIAFEYATSEFDDTVKRDYDQHFDLVKMRKRIQQRIKKQLKDMPDLPQIRESAKSALKNLPQEQIKMHLNYYKTSRFRKDLISKEFESLNKYYQKIIDATDRLIRSDKELAKQRKNLPRVLTLDALVKFANPSV